MKRGSTRFSTGCRTRAESESPNPGTFHVPHFTGKAKIDLIVKAAGFVHHTFVIAPFYYQNLVGALAPQKQADGLLGWALPLDPDVRCIHMGDIREQMASALRDTSFLTGMAT